MSVGALKKLLYVNPEGEPRYLRTTILAGTIAQIGQRGFPGRVSDSTNELIATLVGGKLVNKISYLALTPQQEPILLVDLTIDEKVAHQTALYFNLNGDLDQIPEQIDPRFANLVWQCSTLQSKICKVQTIFGLVGGDLGKSVRQHYGFVDLSPDLAHARAQLQCTDGNTISFTADRLPELSVQCTEKRWSNSGSPWSRLLGSLFSRSRSATKTASKVG